MFAASGAAVANHLTRGLTALPVTAVTRRSREPKGRRFTGTAETGFVFCMSTAPRGVTCSRAEVSPGAAWPTEGL